MKILTRKTMANIGATALFLFSSALSAVAYSERWTGAANDGGNFANINNWSTQYGTPVYFFTAEFDANIGQNGNADVFLDMDMADLITSGIKEIRMAQLYGASSLTIKEGGSLSMSGRFYTGYNAGDNGTLNIQGGNLVTGGMNVGYSTGGKGTFLMTSGVVINSTFNVYNAGSMVNISGGELTTTGDITISSGAAMKVSGGKVSAGYISMTANSTLEVNGSADVEVRNNVMMVVGDSEMKLYGGTLKWTGSDDNYGSIWVSNGSVYLGDGENITAVDCRELKIEMSGIVDINHAKSDYILGAMVRLESGGALNHVGAGTTILTADGFGDSGGTAKIDKGTLQFGNGGSAGHLIGNNVIVTGGATLAINRSDDVNLLGTSGLASLSGDGTIRKMGSGTVTVDAYAFYMDNGNAGLTFEIENGTYAFVGGGFDNTVTVLSHATAGTALDVTDTVVLSLGTLNVNGDVTLKLGNRHGNTNLLHIDTLNGDAGKLLTLDISGLTLADLYQSGGDYCYDLLGVTDYSGFNGEIIAGLSDITDGEDTYTFEGYDWVGGKLVAMYSLGSPIPEPSSYAIIFGVAAAVAVTLRRRRK